MSIELLSTLRARGVQLWAEGNAIMFDAPDGVMSDGFKRSLRQHKAALLRLLSEPAGPCRHCGSGSFHQAEAGGPWLCSTCHPRTKTPVAVLAVCGGAIPQSAERNADVTQ